MRRLTRAAVLLAVAATPVLGVIAAAHPDGVMADNGVISSNGVGGSGSVHILADDGVINSKN